MDQEQNELVKQVFQEALERDETERAAFVEAACEDDLGARDRVMDLLGAYAGADGFLSLPGRAGEAAGSAGYVGSTIGPYKVLQVIGEGGFGTVYMAEQQAPIRRRVALKLIKLGMDTKQVIARFEAERQALAMMEHPNIARVLDAGATDGGRPYFVMELVRGTPITEYCDEHCLSTRERLELFGDVCAAVQHAHQKGVVHRDLKPSNVLVTVRDDRPVPKIIDFGVAQATAHQLTEKTLFTEFGQFIGTPMYMSPEQAEAGGLDVDTRSDVYSLGVLLYELLTGTTPFTSGQIRNVAYAEVLRVLQQVDPPPPSTRVSELSESGDPVARLRRSEPGALQKLLRGDLDWIVMKALEKDRSRRYSSASELAADIGRYFVGDPVSAGPPDLGYRLRKIVRRNRGKATAAAAVVVSLLAGGSAATWQAMRASAAAERAQANAVLAHATATGDPLLKALLIDEIADVPHMPGKLAVLREAANHPLPISVAQLPERPSQWQYSPDGRYVAASFRDGTARLWRADRAAEPRILRHPDAVEGLAFSPDGRWIATGSSDGTLRIWEVEGTGPPVELAGRAPGGLWYLEFSPDNRRVGATSYTEGVITVWPLDGDGDPRVLRVEGVRLIDWEWDPSGDRMLVGGSDGVARIWSVQEPERPLELPGHGSGTPRVAFTPDGERIVVLGGDGNVRVARADGSTPPSLVARADPAMESFTVAPDGRHVVLGYLDGTVRVQPMDGAAEAIVVRPGAAVEHAGMSPDGTRLLAGSWDGKVRAFRIRPTVPLPHLDAIQPQTAVTFTGPPGLAEWEVTRDGAGIAIGFQADGSIRTWRLDDAGEALVVSRGEMPIHDARFSPDGRTIATVSEDGGVRMLSVDGSASPTVLGNHGDASGRLAFSRDGSRLVTSSRDGTARIWSTDGIGEPIVLLHPGPVHSSAFSPDGHWVATAASDGRVRLWDLRDSSAPVDVRAHEGVVRSVSFSPDGTRIASGWDGGLSVVRLGGGGESVVHAGHVHDVAFSPDGGLLATAGDEGEVRVWHVDGKGQAGEFHGHSGEVTDVAFSRDGTRIATAAHDGTARVWRVDRADAPIVLRGHEGPIGAVDFSPDGSRLVTASWDGTVRLWRVTFPELLEYVRSNLHACLTPEQRIRYLAESEGEASDRAAACERRLRGL